MKVKAHKNGDNYALGDKIPYNKSAAVIKSEYTYVLFLSLDVFFFCEEMNRTGERVHKGVEENKHGRGEATAVCKEAENEVKQT